MSRKTYTFLMLLFSLQIRIKELINGMRAEVYVDFKAAIVSVSLSQNSDIETLEEMDGLCIFEEGKLIMQTGETTKDEKEFAKSWM